MPVLLEGGCRVSTLYEGDPLASDGLRVWRHAGREHGAAALSLRILELAAGAIVGMQDGDADDVLYVLAGRGTAFLDGWPQVAEPDTGLYLRAGARLTLHNPETSPLVLASAQCPDPGPGLSLAPPCTSRASGTVEPSPVPLVRLSDRTAETTADRRYRVLVDARVGSSQVTQFVGGIPPGRAPDHYHEYEEVLVILAGHGRMWSGPTHAAIGPGSCVFLPRGQIHCVENTGDGGLRLLGAFYPAGSPAVRYDPVD